MFVFAQDMGIRNWMKILLVSTTVPPFTTAKTKFGTKVLQFSFWTILLNYRPIHEKKECPNPIIISSNMGIGNLVKETLLSASYINPPFAFPTSKDKHKCISTFAWTRPMSPRMQPMSAWTRKKILKIIFYFLFFPTSVRTGPASAWMHSRVLADRKEK
jgi:hypothetical protein